jgi:hypothetical protein
MLDLIPITAQYSNAVLVAVLPYFSQFAQKIELPLPTPISISQVQTFDVSVHRDNLGGYLALTNGYEFWYEHGHVQSFRTPRCYYALHDPRQIPSFYGPIRLTEAQAVEFARSFIRKLGYTEATLYLDLEPEVTPPPSFRGNTIPHYKLEWMSPNRDNFPSTTIEVDAANKQVTSISFLNLNLWQAPPAGLTSLSPPAINQGRPQHFQTNEIFTKITGYAKRLGLPIHFPATGDQILTISSSMPGTNFSGYIELTNKFTFHCFEGDVCGFIAPDVFFTWQHEIRVKDFISERKLTDQQLVSLVQATIQKLGYPTNAFDFRLKPKVQYPRGALKSKIPRMDMEWLKEDKNGIVSRVTAEVDAGSGTIKSLTLYNRDVAAPNY